METTEKNTKRFITFIEPETVGWKVKYDGNCSEYPHVYLGVDGMFQVKKGCIFPLQNLHIEGALYRGCHPGDEGKILWDIPGLINYNDPDNPTPAVFIVYRGSAARVSGKIDWYK